MRALAVSREVRRSESPCCRVLPPAHWCRRFMSERYTLGRIGSHAQTWPHRARSTKRSYDRPALLTGGVVARACVPANTCEPETTNAPNLLLATSRCVATRGVETCVRASAGACG